jgi:hypothetical protein
MASVEEMQIQQKEEQAQPPTPQMAELKSGFVVDTIHTDEAMKIIANYDGQETWDKAEEKRLRKKIDRRLLPILCITYALQYYDKGTICVSCSPCSFLMLSDAALPTV